MKKKKKRKKQQTSSQYTVNFLIMAFLPFRWENFLWLKPVFEFHIITFLNRLLLKNWGEKNREKSSTQIVLLSYFPNGFTAAVSDVISLPDIKYTYCSLESHEKNCRC